MLAAIVMCGARNFHPASSVTPNRPILGSATCAISRANASLKKIAVRPARTLAFWAK